MTGSADPALRLPEEQLCGTDRAGRPTALIPPGGRVSVVVFQADLAD